MQYMVKSVLMDVTTKRPNQGHGLSQHGEVHAGPDSCLITMSKQPRVHSFTWGPRVDSFTRGPRVYFLLLRDHVYVLTQGPLGLFSLSA